MNKSPWVSFPFITTGMLIIESIVVILMVPLLLSSKADFKEVVLVLLVAVLCVVGCWFQKRKFSAIYNYTVQLLLVLFGFFRVEIGVVGVVFLLSWVFIYYLANKLKMQEKQVSFR